MKEQIAIGEPPERASAALALRVIRTMFSHWSATPESDGDLKRLLQAALIDQYERTGKKQGRYRPPLKSKPSAGKPIINDASDKPFERLEKYLEHQAATANVAA